MLLRLRTRHTEHPLVEVRAGDLACRANDLRCQPRQYPRATGHVKHALSGTQSREGHQILRGLHERHDVMPLIGFRTRTRKLPP